MQLSLQYHRKKVRKNDRDQPLHILITQRSGEGGRELPA